MCGLTGIFHAAADQPVDIAMLRAMTTALAHRGPDGDGFHVEPGVGLGHRRLAIIDPEAGEQPMFNEDGSVAIVFNGMIYNYQALHDELAALGHVFRTRCDTETIVHAWEEWGTGCLSRLNGMFAFAIWDRSRASLFLARDRLGKKPLHYGRRPDGSLAFASELGGLVPVADLDRRLDSRAVDDFFTYGYVPDPATIFRGIHKLPAGHFLLLHHDQLQTGRPMPVPQCYWHAKAAVQQIGEAEAIDQLRVWLDDVVAKRLIADVPLGAFLSGGVDSSAVVAVAAALRERAGHSALDTFTIGFGGAEDETGFAEQVAARYRTIQHSDTGTLDYLQGARDLGRLFGEPFGDSSAIPTLGVCALARRHAKVAVSGDGGDEVLGGYRRYQWHRMTEAVRTWLPAGVRRGVVGQLARIYPKMDFAPRWLRAKYTLSELSLDSALGYFRMVAKVHHDTRRSLFAAPVLAELDGYDPSQRIADAMDATDDRDPLRQAQSADIDTYLVGDILTKVDRASMAHSLEVRAPLLDYRFVEWGLGLPANLKLHRGTGKYVFKRAMEDRLPREILYRPKQGFATSLAGLFRAHADLLRERLLGPAMWECGLFRPASIARLLDEHAGARSDHSHVLWLLLVFEGFLVAGSTAPMPRQAADLAHA